MRILLILLAASLSTMASAQELLKYHANVLLSVSADDAIKGEITSFMSRELRELGDVTVVDENPQWEIQVVAMESYLQNGHKSGFVISVVLFQHYNPGLFDMLFEKKQAEAAKKLTAGLVLYPDHWLRTGSNENLNKVCQGIIADFDSKHLANARKGFADLLKQYKQMQQQPTK